MKPSDLKGVCPMDSIHKHMENEQHMMWIVQKLAETGDTWRKMPAEEYKKLGGGDSAEYYIKNYLPYIASEDTIVLYSPVYKEKAEEVNSSITQ